MQARARKVSLRPKDTPWSGDELKEWRERHNLSQVQAADALGFPPRSIEDWERGARKPAYPVSVRKLMEAYKPSRRA